MAKRTARKEKIARVTAANRRAAAPLGQVTRFGRPDLLILLGLAVVTFAIYAQVSGHQFIALDDDSYIKENPIVNRGVTLAGLAWAFTTFYQANWHPLTWISHMIDSQLFGLRAGAHLLVNALLSAANNARAVAQRADRGAFCAASVARGIGGVGSRTQRYALDLFRPAFANRLHAICRDALAQVVRLDWCRACAGIDGQTDAGDLAFRDVVARLLAVAPISEIRSQTSEVSTP